MPLVLTEDGTQYRAHKWPGGHTKKMVSKALKLNAQVEEENGVITVAVENVGAGHNIPTELRHRALDLEVTVKTGWLQSDNYRYRFRNPYKGEGGPNTQLRFGERRQLSFPIPMAKGEITVRLVYRLMPFGEGGDGEVIRELLIPFHRKQEKS
jgi:hypothetical protein